MCGVTSPRTRGDDSIGSFIHLLSDWMNVTASSRLDLRAYLLPVYLTSWAASVASSVKSRNNEVFAHGKYCAIHATCRLIHFTAHSGTGVFVNPSLALTLCRTGVIARATNSCQRANSAVLASSYSSSPGQVLDYPGAQSIFPKGGL